MSKTLQDFRKNPVPRFLMTINKPWHGVFAKVLHFYNSFTMFYSGFSTHERQANTFDQTFTENTKPMTNVNKLVFTLFCSIASTYCFGQQAFTNCTAAFLDNKMVVDQYTPKGKCMLTSKATGNLTVCTVDLSRTESKRVDKIPFRVAIRDKNTQTLVMVSKNDVEQIDVQNVLTKCRKGDHIVLLTVDNRYAMPHNEILVQ